MRCLSVILMLMTYDHIVFLRKRKLVLEDYSVTFGKIIRYSEVSTAQHRRLYYTYLAKGKEYKREMVPGVRFEECDGEIELCSRKYFLVIYSYKDHFKSLINPKDEILHPELMDAKKVVYQSSQSFDTLWISRSEHAA